MKKENLEAIIAQYYIALNAAKELENILKNEGIYEDDSRLDNACNALWCAVEDIQGAMYKDYGISLEFN